MVPAIAMFRASGIVAAALIVWIGTESAGFAQTTTPPPAKKKTPAPPPQKSNPRPVVSPSSSGVVSVPAASSLAGTRYAPAAVPSNSQISTYPALSPLYAGLNSVLYPPYPQLPSYYSPLMTPSYSYPGMVPGLSPYGLYTSPSIYNFPVNYNPYTNSLYSPNPLLSSYPGLAGFAALGQPNPFDAQMGIYRGIGLPGAALPPYTGLGSWNNPFGLGAAGFGGLGN